MVSNDCQSLMAPKNTVKAKVLAGWQQLRTLAVLIGDLSSVLSICAWQFTTPYTPAPGDPKPSSGLSRHVHHTRINENKINLKTI